MSSLSGSLWIAERALQADQGALNVTTNNIANANTPGYSREIAILSETSPIERSGLVYGTGVDLQQIQSVRDQILSLRIAQETSQQGSSQAQANALGQVEALFGSSTQGIGADFSAFFNSLSQLSTNPSSIPDRQSVLNAAQNLASDFNHAAANLNTITTGLNQTMTQTVTQINTLSQQIAQLNGQVADLQRQGKDAGTLQDQENQLINQLSQLTNVNETQTPDGLTLTTGNGAALVVGNQSFALQTSKDASGNVTIMSQGTDITSSISGGSLGGTIQVADTQIPNVLTQLNNLASQFADAMNTAQAAGYDLNGNRGQPMFSVVAGGGAAGSLSVAITDPSLIAASSDGTPGSNGNVANLVAVQTQALPGGANPGDTYANLVSQVGNLTMQAQDSANASSSSLTQLNNQLGAISGVSIDEETTNLMNYQRAYEAAARMITTVDTLTQVVLQMGASAQAAP
ncbi:MAG TPA: flagellar hook-associated protein FlgK [Terriglobales bacterium]|nr:flagellar hook-associated protein FlgK [Terriglobales bacterium]